MMKKQFMYTWKDRSKQIGKMSRNRVAYLLKAARSRLEKIEKTENGYLIDTLAIFPQMETTYFACISLNETVHVQALGFTDFLTKYVNAESKQEAKDKIRRHYDFLKIRKIDLNPALIQQENNHFGIIK